MRFRNVRSFLCIFALAALLSGQESDETAGGKPAVIPPAEKARLASLLPDAETPSEDASFYSTDLYRLIDGGAEVYHQYGMVAMTHREYKSGSMESTVEIYDIGDPLRAFGIYSAERSPDYHFIPIGAEGYAEEGTLNFFQGDYYVKLQALGDKADTRLLAAANRISAGIGTDCGMPPALAWLPTKGLAPHSQKYLVEAPMGHAYLSPAIAATYRLGGAETTVLAAIASNAADAAQRLKSLRDYYEKNGKTSALAGLPVLAWKTSNQYEGDVIFFVRGRSLVMVQHPPSQPEGFLKELIANIKD